MYPEDGLHVPRGGGDGPPSRPVWAREEVQKVLSRKMKIQREDG